jgi:uncharacterized membrane protein YheB (UPF0754 family)
MLYLLPFISAFIGWITNWVAIKMLFHPRVEKQFLGIKIQGIFPKRQQQFAEKLGTLVSKELISFDEIAAKINTPTTIQKALPLIESHVNHFIDTKLKEEIPLLSMFISGGTIDKIKKGIVTEVEGMIPEMLNGLLNGMKTELDVEKIVIQKVAAFSSDKLEDILMGIMKKEFKFVELVGAVLGFLIGLIQVALTLWT